MRLDEASSVGATQGAAPTDDPWVRYGWLMGAIWLVFMAFPLIGAVRAEASSVAKGATVLALAVFAGVYLYAIWLDDQSAAPGSGVYPWGFIGLLVALALAAVPVIGLGALGLVPFVLALTGIALPTRQALAALVLALVILAVSTSVFARVVDWFFFFLIYPMVTLTLVPVRVLEGGSERQREVARQLEISEERERVARDVHDVLGHSLTVVTIKAELAERLVDADPERAKVELAEVRSIAREALAEIRATVAGLRVARLTDELDSARSALGDAGIAASVEGDPHEVDPRHRIALAWAVRELTTNVLRHSAATTCRIEVGEDRIAVTDDGRGSRGSREGNGLRGLRERVEPTGGTVVVEPADPGTRVEVRL
ncbi:sensor histidine kinase [Janibacter sp. YIM B02568]|uniref:sensor histidine kinase n=1 Tax=Janibacter endophyticus TaxID=2806261 RepID=UPI0019519EA8|nr:sensor histidine kinase [Janibacter endophyticus]MBM6546787.1 sensor histidine kinase [Janibacter endophyticus]